MFARQVDPLAAYNSVLLAAQQQHRAQREALDRANNAGNGTDASAKCSSNSNNNSNTGISSRTNNNTVDTSLHNPYKRKHAFHFEPDFFAALDASLRDTGEEGVVDISSHGDSNPLIHNSNYPTAFPQKTGPPWPARPVKRARRSTTNVTSPKPMAQHSASPSPSSFNTAASTQHTPVFSNEPRSSSFSSWSSFPSSSLSWSPLSTSHKATCLSRRPNSNGPSIFDLSSGEELVPLHLGDNEHKRRRDYDSVLSHSGGLDSLREVFEYHHDDGTLRPIMDHAPALPSPAKKVRLGRPSHHPHLFFLSECETGINPRMGRDQTQRDENLSSSSSSSASQWPVFTSGFDEVRMGDDLQASEGDEDQQNQFDAVTAPQLGRRALVRSKGGSNLFRLSAGLAALDCEHWRDLQPARIIPLEELQGHELVLYEKPMGSLDGGDEGNEEKRTGGYSSARIEELDDEDDEEGHMADDESCELPDDGPLMELEEKIMEMELD